MTVRVVMVVLTLWIVWATAPILIPVGGLVWLAMTVHKSKQRPQPIPLRRRR